MNTLGTRVAAFWQEMRVSTITTLATLFAVRLLSIALNLRTNLGELWRPRLEQPEWGGWLILLLFIPLLFSMHRGFRQLSNRLQNRFLLYQALTYLIMGLFNNLVDHRCYLYQLFDGRLDFEGLQSLMIMDTFFQPPGLFWGISWMALCLFFAGKKGYKAWVPLLWVLPFAGFNYYFNNLLIVFFLASTAASLTAFFLRQSGSSRTLYLFQGLFFAAILAFLTSSPIIYRSAWLTAIVLMPICWLPGYWFIRQCEGEESRAAIAMTWLMPVFAGGLLSQVLFNAPLAKSLFNFWFILVSFNYASEAITWVITALAFSFLVGFMLPRFQRHIFSLAASLIAIFYLADAVLLYKNGMHLNFAALDWVWGLQNFSSILSTAEALIDEQIAMAALCLPLLATGSYILVTRRTTCRKPLLSGFAIYLIITAQISIAGYQLLTDLPSVLRDPVRNLLTSLPLPKYFQAEKPEIKDLLLGFSDCNIPFPVSTRHPAAVNADNSNRKNVILIMLESTSNRYLSLFGHDEMTWPEMDRYKARMEIFPFIFSCFPESSNADFAVMSGMYPPSYLFLRQKPEFNHPTLIEKLKRNNFDCFMYFSGFIGDTGLSSFYRPRGFTGLFDAVSLPGTSREDGWVWGIKEHIMVDRINELLKKRSASQKKPFFIYYRMIFPHSPFDRVTDDPPFFPEEDYFRRSWVGRFKNCLLYQDQQIARLIKQLDETGLAKNTIVVAVGDHGTMLGEDGQHGHGWNLEPELINVPLIIIRPEATGLKVNSRPGSHADLQPTILNLAGIDDSQPSFAQGNSLFQVQNASSSIYLSSLMHRAVIENDHFFLFPVENSANAMVFKLNRDNPGKRFSQIASWPSEDLLAKFQRLNRFFKLQNHLLTNIEYYEAQSAKN